MWLAGLLGRFVGLLVSPLVFLIGLVRGARVFHPAGLVYRAQVVPLATTGAHGDLAERLAGDAIIRLSGSFRAADSEAADALGIAIRFRAAGAPITHVADRDDQDLLMCTFRSFPKMFDGVSKTDAHDFLANDYDGVAPFQAAGFAGQVKLRAVGSRPGGAGKRADKLAAAASAGTASLRLEIMLPAAQVGPLVEIKLLAPAPVDQRRLRMSPFRRGRGLKAVGFTHGTRVCAYAASQWARKVWGR